jgi:transposase, IS5 family
MPVDVGVLIFLEVPMCALLYLKHAFNLSNEALYERWAENVVWQYFSGMDYYEPRLPCGRHTDRPLQDGHGRDRYGGDPQGHVDTAVAIKALKASEFKRVIVDTTVQEKAIVYLNGARLLEIARHHIVKAAKA